MAAYPVATFAGTGACAAAEAAKVKRAAMATRIARILIVIAPPPGLIAAHRNGCDKQRCKK
jgi:hypothetical protein